jgi:outer membrane protein assembly factor BamA
MNRVIALLTASLLFCSLPSAAQKKAAKSAQRKAPARTIRFEGAPQYTQDELLAAAGVTQSARLTPTEVKAHAKQLYDTGLFAAIKFSTDAKGLLFTLTPASQLFPIHLDNLPLNAETTGPGKDLDDKLHAQFPLYHGQVPASGSMVDGICRAFEQMLAAQGMKATVKASLTSDLGPKKITAMNFAITSPPVHIGRIQISGVSPAMQAKVNVLVSGQTGNEFDTENSAIGLQHAFEDLYQDQGYAAVQVQVTQSETPVVSDQAIEIPYSVAIKEGGIYKLGAISYPPDALMPRAEVQKVLSKYPAGSGRPLDLYLLAVRDAYHARGYLDCEVNTHPTFNEAVHIVSYSVEAVPGPLYQMGSVEFEGAPAAMADRLKHLWKLAPGATFDESYVSGFAAFAEKKDRVLAKWMQTVLTTDEVKPDTDTHRVSVVFHFAKATQDGR